MTDYKLDKIKILNFVKKELFWPPNDEIKITPIIPEKDLPPGLLVEGTFNRYIFFKTNWAFCIHQHHIYRWL